MTSNMHIQHSVPGLGRTLLSTFQTGHIAFINSGWLYSDVLFNEVKNLVLGGYTSIQDAVNYITHAAPGPDMVGLEESIILQNQTSNAQYITSPQREAGSMLEQRLHSHSNSESFLSATDDSEEARQPASHEDHSSEPVTVARSKRIWIWIAVLVAGVLSLVVGPGLVVGIITGQMAWGIALAGAIATLVSFFAGLYYYHNK